MVDTEGSPIIKMPSCQYWDSDYKDKTIVRLFDRYDGNPTPAKTLFKLRQNPGSCNSLKPESYHDSNHDASFDNSGCRFKFQVAIIIIFDLQCCCLTPPNNLPKNSLSWILHFNWILIKKHNVCRKYIQYVVWPQWVSLTAIHRLTYRYGNCPRKLFREPTFLSN